MKLLLGATLSQNDVIFFINFVLVIKKKIFSTIFIFFFPLALTFSFTLIFFENKQALKKMVNYTHTPLPPSRFGGMIVIPESELKK